MMTKFEEGKFYRWVGCRHTRPNHFNSSGLMDFLLDGEPHKCVSCNGDVHVRFHEDDLSKYGKGQHWYLGNYIGNFEEVPTNKLDFRSDKWYRWRGPEDFQHAIWTDEMYKFIHSGNWFKGSSEFVQRKVWKVKDYFEYFEVSSEEPAPINKEKFRFKPGHWYRWVCHSVSFPRPELWAESMYNFFIVSRVWRLCTDIFTDGTTKFEGLSYALQFREWKLKEFFEESPGVMNPEYLREAIAGEKREFTGTMSTKRFHKFIYNPNGETVTTNEPVWVTQNGREIPISKLSDRHLHNILIKRARGGLVNINTFVLFMLERELERRQRGASKRKDAPYYKEGRVTTIKLPAQNASGLIVKSKFKSAGW